MGAADPSFLIQIISSTGDRLQTYRELTQNALEAFKGMSEAETAKGRIEWLIDPYETALGRTKLAIADNGVGMTPDEMIHLLNNLAASGKERAMGGNFGVGAKITALAFNREGIVYRSWKDGRGARVHLKFDESAGGYGLLKLRDVPGDDAFWEPVDGSAPLKWIGRHGTIVTLLGDSPEHDTSMPPKGMSLPSRWLTHYINRRYMTLPTSPEIIVTVAEGLQNKKTSRAIKGQLSLLADVSSHQGEVPVSGAVAKWWFIPDPKDLDNAYGLFRGTAGIVWEKEIYSAPNKDLRRLRDMGIIYIGRQTLVLFEPSGGVAVDIGRRTLTLKNGTVIPWDDWEADFRERMPDELRALNAHAGHRAASDEDRRSIVESLLGAIPAALMQMSRYRHSLSGSYEVDPFNAVPGGVPILTGDTLENPITRARREKPGSEQTGRSGSGANYSGTLQEGGKKANRAPMLEAPQVIWSDETEQEDLKDRAALYSAGTRTIIANKEFSGLQDLVRFFFQEWGEQPGTKVTVEETIKVYYETIFIQHVMFAERMHGRKEWSKENVETLLSSESLTSLTFERAHSTKWIKGKLTADLGAPP